MNFKAIILLLGVVAVLNVVTSEQASPIDDDKPAREESKSKGHVRHDSRSGRDKLEVEEGPQDDRSYADLQAELQGFFDLEKESDGFEGDGRKGEPQSTRGIR